MFPRTSRRLRNNMLLGLALVTPIGITILIANWLFVLVTNVFLTERLETSGMQLLYRAAALLIVLFILCLIGFLAKSFLGKRLYRLGDGLITRLPFISGIYVQVRHISEVLVAQRQTLFKNVVMVEYPRRGVYSVGFLTAGVPSPMSGQMHSESGSTDFVSIFIPTTPNPTSGLMIMAPRADVIPLNMDVAEAMKFIVSAGAVHPGEEPLGSGTTLLDKLEAWHDRMKSEHDD